MYLVTAATAFEMEAFRRACPPAVRYQQLLTGIGPVEAAVQVTSYLARASVSFKGVVNLGVAGAYQQDQNEPGVGLLDICLAEREVLGDLGICYQDAVESLRGESFEIQDTFPLDRQLLHRAEALIIRGKMVAKRGTFVTVNCVSGSRQRGALLARRHQALCENMEGAAVARVCVQFGLPLLELRCISNLVEDRNLQNWQLKKACTCCGEVAALVLEGLSHD
ncbi:MAG: futalosine hydrolase [Desulfobulbaceae bacterium]|nr:futalosine hydrolase [Desulfobulbaceae bacterium]